MAAARRLTLNRPEKLNAIDGEMHSAFFEAVDEAIADPATPMIPVKAHRRAGRSPSRYEAAVNS